MSDTRNTSTTPEEFKILFFNPEDLKWIKSINRNDFDKPREAYQKKELVDIIERSKRIGLYDEAKQMEDDLLAEFGPEEKEVNEDL